MDITDLLTLCVGKGASDLHLSPQLPPLLRIDGELRRTELPPLPAAQVEEMLHSVMNQRQRRDYARLLDTDFALEVPAVGRFRVNALHQQRGAAGVFRAIPGRLLSMEELGLGPVFTELARLPRGLVLITGPTGSGKSTTLAAMVDHINRQRHEHILTVEDPIEYVHQSNNCLVTQRQVQRDTSGFGAALRAALREDPDIILVGEMRDPETIKLALEAAETGHLVLATLHTLSAAKTIDRVIDAFPAAQQAVVRSMLSESLQAVISQILLPRPGGGRVAAHEILRGTAAVRNLIREGKVAQMYSAMQTGAAQGMQTLEQCLEKLQRQGSISPQVARAKATTVPGPASS